MMEEYDSKDDTIRHIRRVRTLLLRIDRELMRRADEHDRSKLRPPEKPIYDEYTPKLADVEYGSQKYERFLEEMQVALDHHYGEYRHHPEHFEGGVHSMHLLDVLEMLVDWYAAVERHNDDNGIIDSIEKNADRFGYDSDGLFATVLRNTATWLSELSTEEGDE